MVSNKISEGSKTFEDAGRFLMVELLLWPQVDDGVKNPWFTVDWFTEKILPMVHKSIKKRTPHKQKMVGSLNCLRVLYNGGAIEKTINARIITGKRMKEEDILLSTDQQKEISDGKKLRANSLRRLTVGEPQGIDYWINSARTDRYDKHIQKSWDDLMKLLSEDVKIAKDEGMTSEEFYKMKGWI
tara:strand:+ start:1582 stop:2136 length:555 start_codon:yes stop_codon:yes gene_type:complete